MKSVRFGVRPLRFHSLIDDLTDFLCAPISSCRGETKRFESEVRSSKKYIKRIPTREKCINIFLLE